MKKILFVTYDFPYPPDSGGKTRAYNLLKFANQNCQMHLFSFTRKNPTTEEKKALENIGIKTITTHKRNAKKNIKSVLSVLTKNSIFKALYFDPKVLQKLQSIVEEEGIDIIHFESYYTGFYIHSNFSEKGVKQILGTENIEHQLYDLYTEKNAAYLTRPVLRREVKKIKKEELEMIRTCDEALAVTKKECSYIAESGAKKCTVIENGVDVDFFSKSKKNLTTPKVLFIGNFSYFPNIDAIKYFYQEVFPSIPKDIVVKVVGKNYKNTGIANPKFEFIEYIEDIREAYTDVFAMISPIRIGGGTNFKILESMAARTPVVADPSRIDDVGAKVGTQILTAKDPQDFAEKIRLLKDDKNLRETISQNAYNFVSQTYAWNNIGSRLNNVYQNI